MRLEDWRGYLGAKEYLRRLDNVLADGSSFLRGDDLQLFSASLNRRHGQVKRAVEEFELRMLFADLPLQESATTLRILLQGSFDAPEQRSASWSWTFPTEHAGVLCTFRALQPDRQLQLFALGSYEAESSVVFGPWQEPIGLSA